MSCAEALASMQTYAINVDESDAVAALNSLANQTNYPLLFDFDRQIFPSTLSSSTDSQILQARKKTTSD